MKDLPAHEKFLRFESLKDTTQLMRARAVYLTGLALIATQFINIFFMTVSYGQWIIDHAISAAACIGAALVVLGLRYTKNFHVFAVVYSLMLFASIWMSASSDSTGIDTALLPMIVVGALLNGFIGGWRHILLYGFTALAFIWKLYDISITALLLEVMDDPTAKTRLFQRAMQASLALLMTSVCTSLIIYTMTCLFEELDDVLTKLNRSNKQKTDFLAHMSGELSRPLAGVNGGLKKLSTQDLNPVERNYVQITQAYARRLTQFIADVTVLSNLDKGRFKLQDGKLNLRDETNTLLGVYKNIAAKKGVHLGMTYAAHLPETYSGDIHRIRQVMKNLIHNAFKYTENGSIHIYVDGRLKGADEVQLRISIKDTGTGIESSHLESVFDRFDAGATQNRDRKFVGTGLELAICHEVITFMGGTLNVESQLNAGSNFEVTLTLKVVEAQISDTKTTAVVSALSNSLPEKAA